MATIALSALRSKLQTFLRDTSAKKWSTADLDTYINLAIVKWTSDVPIKSSNTLTVVSGQHEYDLPDNTVSVSLLKGYFESSSTQEYLAPMQMKPGAFTDLDEPRRFVVGFPTESQIYVTRAPISGTTMTLYYGAKHSPLGSDSATLDLRMYAWGELAVLYYAAYLAYLPYSASRARQEQWAGRNDLNVGNPLQEESQKFREAYEQLIAEHTEPASWEFVLLDRV